MIYFLQLLKTNWLSETIYSQTQPAFICWNSAIITIIKCKICSKLTREATYYSGVFIVNFEYIWLVSNVSNVSCFPVFDMKMLDGILHCLRGPLSSQRQYLATESPLKMMKNVFCFILKELFLFSRYLSFHFDFLVMHKMAWLESWG